MVEEKTLSEVLAERRVHFGYKVVDIVNEVYGSRNLNFIENFEEVISKLGERVSSRSLEDFFDVGMPSESKRNDAELGKIKLTFDLYTEERNSGLTHEQIKEKYSEHMKALGVHSDKVLGGYSANYSRWRAPKDQNAETPGKEFTLGLYVQERQAGLNNEQIAEKYNITGDNLMEYAEAYTKQKKPRAKKDDKMVTDGDKRPRLTSYQYAKSRGEEMTDDQIKAKFRVDSPQQLDDLRAQYTERNSAQ